jgi:NTP pyrophosphatase (non-canonical NTP hydrolase)
MTSLPSNGEPLPDLGLREAQHVVDDWIHRVGVRYFSELTNTAILAEEVGEVARIMARRYGDQSFKAGEAHDLGEELADVLFVLLCLANQTGTDLAEAFRQRMERKTQRDRDRHRDNPKLTS